MRAVRLRRDAPDEDYLHVVDVDLKSYFDTIDHELLLGLVERRVEDVRILRLIRA
jgi:retron-type reverse transcriptase